MTHAMSDGWTKSCTVLTNALLCFLKAPFGLDEAQSGVPVWMDSVGYCMTDDVDVDRWQLQTINLDMLKVFPGDV